MSSIPIEEQETNISYSRDGKIVNIYTSDSTVMTKLDRLVKNSEYYTLTGVGRIGKDVVSKEYECTDKSLISFRSTKVKGREMTEEQKKAAAERLAKSRKNKTDV